MRIETSCYDCGEDITIEGAYIRDFDNVEVICWDCQSDIESQKQSDEHKMFNGLEFLSSAFGYIEDDAFKAMCSCFGLTPEDVEIHRTAKKFTPRYGISTVYGPNAI